MSKVKLAVLALIIANIIWGAGSPIFKWSLQSVHPFTLGFFRFAIPAVFIAVFFPKKLRIKLKDFHLFVLAGLLGIGINVSAYFLGIEKTASINAPIISSSGPVFVLLGSILFLKEHPSKKMLLGNLIGLTGVLLIILEPVLHNTNTSSLAGNLYLIVATLASVGGTLVLRTLAQKYHALTLTFWTFFIGSIVFVPQFVAEIESQGLASQLTFQGSFGIVYGFIFSSFVAYTLLYWALRYLKASQTTVFTYTDPVVAILIAAPLIHEYPTLLFVLGSLLVFFGIFVAEGRVHYHPLHLLLKRK